MSLGYQRDAPSQMSSVTTYTPKTRIGRSAAIAAPFVSRGARDYRDSDATAEARASAETGLDSTR